MSGSTFQLRRSNWKVKIENQFFFQFSRAAWAEQWQKYPHLYFNEYWSKIRYYFVRWCQNYRFITLNNWRISITWFLALLLGKNLFFLYGRFYNFPKLQSRYICNLIDITLWNNDFLYLVLKNDGHWTDISILKKITFKLVEQGVNICLNAPTYIWEWYSKFTILGKGFAAANHKENLFLHQ